MDAAPYVHLKSVSYIQLYLPTNFSFERLLPIMKLTLAFVSALAAAASVDAGVHK